MGQVNRVAFKAGETPVRRQHRDAPASPSVRFPSLTRQKATRKHFSIEQAGFTALLK
jgi:hypothetical protein